MEDMSPNDIIEDHTEPDPLTDAGNLDAIEPGIMMSELFDRANVQREDGVHIIWNASGVFPMNPGTRLKIEDTEYISVGVLEDTHLLIGIQDSEAP